MFFKSLPSLVGVFLQIFDQFGSFLILRIVEDLYFDVFHRVMLPKVLQSMVNAAHKLVVILHR